MLYTFCQLGWTEHMRQRFSDPIEFGSTYIYQDSWKWESQPEVQESLVQDKPEESQIHLSANEL